MVLSDLAKNAMLQGLADVLNAGNNSVLSIYIDTVLAAELALVNPVELNITGGVLTFKTPPEALAIASGIPTSAKLISATGELIADYAAAEITLNKDKIYQGGYVGIQSLTVRI
ncbi:hypothetical protein [Psychrobacter alimentarius]|uniref:hypothetical protein n=1 Tax=Psychrobacter alimentarius TaxID=261164 RepID=UPI003FD0EF3C